MVAATYKKTHILYKYLIANNFINWSLIFHLGLGLFHPDESLVSWQIIPLYTPEINSPPCNLADMAVYAGISCKWFWIENNTLFCLKDEEISNLKQMEQPIQIAGDGKFDSPGGAL